MLSSTRKRSRRNSYKDSSNPYGSTQIVPKKPSYSTQRSSRKSSFRPNPRGSTQITSNMDCTRVRETYGNDRQLFMRDKHPIYNNGKTSRKEYVQMDACFDHPISPDNDNEYCDGKADKDSCCRTVRSKYPINEDGNQRFLADYYPDYTGGNEVRTDYYIRKKSCFDHRSPDKNKKPYTESWDPTTAQEYRP